MPLLVIAYFVIGAVVAIVVPLLDLSKKRTSIAGFLGDIAALHVIGFIVYVTLWPLWLTLMVFGSDEE